jgi:hypothetical protein
MTMRYPGILRNSLLPRREFDGRRALFDARPSGRLERVPDHVRLRQREKIREVTLLGACIAASVVMIAALLWVLGTGVAVPVRF